MIADWPIPMMSDHLTERRINSFFHPSLNRIPEKPIRFHSSISDIYHDDNYAELDDSNNVRLWPKHLCCLPLIERYSIN